MRDIAYNERIGIEVCAITASDKEEGSYAIFGDNRLFIVNVVTQTVQELAKLTNIQVNAHDVDEERLEEKSAEISIIYQHPYICVVERFGLNMALYSMASANIREYRREDYCCNVSSYSVGFLKLNGRILLICQTQWNRLDIFDAETGENLTEREIYICDTGRKAKEGYSIFDEKNYMDYFHSRLHVSPTGKHFLSNGWHWHPLGQIYLFETTEFLKTFESGSISTYYQAPYNWDRPCTFIDDETFVMALDDDSKNDFSDGEDLKNYEYFQLAFFKTDAETHTSEYERCWIEPFRKVKCSAFMPQNKGEVTGSLFYDKSADHLVALTHDRGAFAVSLDGVILENLPEVIGGNAGICYSNTAIGWNYSTEHHVFYTWKNGIGIVEKRFKMCTF